MGDAQGSGAAQKVRKPIFLRWWFWPGLLVLFAVTWYFQGYIEWFGDQAKFRIQNSAREAYFNQVKSQDAALEAKYRADTYGGATPEETLRMFIEALEKKDYVLASKYFLIERQEENLGLMPGGEKSGGLVKFTNAYRTGDIKFNKFTSGNQYEVEILPEGEDVGYYLRFVLNKFTNRWKIEDF